MAIYTRGNNDNEAAWHTLVALTEPPSLHTLILDPESPRLNDQGLCALLWEALLCHVGVKEQVPLGSERRPDGGGLDTDGAASAPARDPMGTARDSPRPLLKLRLRGRLSSGRLTPGAHSFAASAAFASAPTSATFASTTTASPVAHTDAAPAAPTGPNSDRVQGAFQCTCAAWTRCSCCTCSPMNASGM